MQARIQQLANTYLPELISWRRHLHQNPELSYQEFETAAFVQDKLTAWNIPYQVMAGTGVIGLIKGNNPQKKVIALRADLDALPIQEENNTPYRSCKPGIMHACGHDAHTACLLGAAKILQETKDQWEGTVKLIFQPGEEKNPGGASLLIKEGVLENPRPDAIFALHVHTTLDTGKVSFRSGKVMASADEIYITIHGKGGHAASPQTAIDPILISAHLITTLQQMVSRRNDPFNPCVLSITSIQGGTTTNVIPDQVKLMGTFRALNEKWRFEAHQLIRETTEQLVASMGGQADLHIDIGYPCVVNEQNITSQAQQLARAFIGESNVSETEIRMGAEDFGFYGQKIPACFFRLGTRNTEKGINSGVHTSTFDVDESALEYGAGLLAWLAVAVLPT
ncbi:MAG: amidohydrolase [Bacteroidetes bacterium]|nr:amidohydrolase [Bacteroidota bacterium]